MRASPARRRCGASRGASQMPSSGASWLIRWCLLTAPLDKEEPRTPLWRSSQNSHGRLDSGLTQNPFFLPTSFYLALLGSHPLALAIFCSYHLRGCADRRVANVSTSDEEPI